LETKIAIAGKKEVKGGEESGNQAQKQGNEEPGKELDRRKIGCYLKSDILMCKNGEMGRKGKGRR